LVNIIPERLSLQQEYHGVNYLVSIEQLIRGDNHFHDTYQRNRAMIHRTSRYYQEKEKRVLTAEIDGIYLRKISS